MRFDGNHGSETRKGESRDGDRSCDTLPRGELVAVHELNGDAAHLNHIAVVQ